MLEEQLKLMRLRYSEEFPDIKRIKAQIANLKAAEADDAKTAAPAGPSTTAGIPVAPGRPAATQEAMRELGQARERTAHLQAQLKLTNRELETEAAEQRSVLAAIGAYEKRLAQLPVRQQEMAGLTRDYDFKANYKSAVGKERKRGDGEGDGDAGGREVYSARSARSERHSPNRPLFAGLAAVALMFGLAFGAVREISRVPVG
jgi:uncharacterized protein involved in exopolysaccharide biosynthesis